MSGLFPAHGGIISALAPARIDCRSKSDGNYRTSDIFENFPSVCYRMFHRRFDMKSTTESSFLNDRGDPTLRSEVGKAVSGNQFLQE